MDISLKLTKRQLDFVNAKTTEVLFGGAAGGGKSYGQLVDALLYALKYPGSKQLILRRTFPDLERSLVIVHLSFYPLKSYRYNSGTHRGRFANGSTIEFGYLDSEKDVFQYQGAEYDTIRFDELTHFTEYQYTYLISRLRGANNFPKQVKSSTNPGGVGHSWVKARFVDIGPPNVPVQCGRNTRIFLPSFVQDNKFLMESDPEYLARLEELPEKERRALLLGDWDIFDGVAFPEFKRPVHVCRPFPLVGSYRKYVALDYGMDMLAGYLIAVDEFGNAFVIREVYKSGLIISAAAEALLEMVGEDDVDIWLAPPDLWNARQETGKSAADIFAENGVPLTQSSNRRSDGWYAVHEYLKVKQDMFGRERAKLQIFDCCTNLIRTLPAVQIDERKPDDVAKEPHELTHAPDALRYFCVYWTTAAAGIAKRSKIKWSEDQWEDYWSADDKTRRYLIDKWGEPDGI